METRPADDTADKFEVPEGFEVALVANDEIAHDIFSMTLDDLGRPVVSGPGYIKTLIDKDRDGRFESSVVWAPLPKQGAQGLWREGNDLYWVGDGGLWKSVDANGDLMGDGQPMRVLNLPTGGEHDAHAIRRGPDGFWYLTAGNFAKGIAALANDNVAPVQKPRAERYGGSVLTSRHAAFGVTDFAISMTLIFCPMVSSRPMIAMMNGI
ncbi:MAG: hypothetical protein U0905_03020 [Pirellulales bacterium]